MEWSPSSEDDSCSAGQEISHILQNVNLQYSVHQSLPFDLTLSQINPSHTLTSDRLKINLIQIFCTHFSHFPYMLYAPFHLIFLNLVTLITFGEERKL